jgi:holin-like protein
VEYIGGSDLLTGILVLLVFQLGGEVIVRLLGLPIPGPVVGLVLMFGALLVRGSLPAFLHRASRALLSVLALLFVPAGVGVIAYLDLLQESWIALIITLIASTAITMAVTAVVFSLLLRWFGPSGGQEARES